LGVVYAGRHTYRLRDKPLHDVVFSCTSSIGPLARLASVIPAASAARFWGVCCSEGGQTAADVFTAHRASGSIAPGVSRRWIGGTALPLLC